MQGVLPTTHRLAAEDTRPAGTPLLGSPEPEPLRAMDILADLSDAEVERLLETSPMQTVPSGTLLYSPQDGPDMLFLLKSGRVELYRESPDGRRLTLVIVDEGTIFGEVSLVDHGLRGTGAVTIKDSVMCALDTDDVRSLMLRHPTVALRVIKVLGSRLQEARDSLQDMAFNDVTGRVAGLLLRLADEQTNVVEGFTHRDLAAMVGCLRESLTTTLDRFKESDAVSIGRKRIEIRDPSQLEAVVRQRSGVPV
ncbi:MAG: Crp/Fnr family transcriptional regulator [Chloroflexi bacterium]|nr:Crp/Fnr family transcriptional regulator [Chloroflexota bacterium]